MSYSGDYSYLFGANTTYISDMYEKFLKDSSSVDSEWVEFFSGLEEESTTALRELKGGRETRVVGVDSEDKTVSDMSFDEKPNDIVATLNDALNRLQNGTGLSSSDTRQATLDTARAMLFIRAYRVFGHFKADLDPLGMRDYQENLELKPESYGFNVETDMDRPIFLNYSFGLESATLREIINVCEKLYCGKLGYEFLYITCKKEKDWFRERIESNNELYTFHDEGKKTTLNRLAHTDSFEKFLDKKHRGAKRFGLDGGESLIPLVEQVIMRVGEKGVQKVVMGMAHRGRLNMLCNVFKKPYTALFSEFLGGSANPDDVDVSGDVKYHLGASSTRKLNNCTVNLTLAPNPSHLEAVNTVVLGKIAAEQHRTNDVDYDKNMAILLHGDASFIGQGVVAETFLLSQLDGYKTGGTVHIVINNQIGFTTKPSKSRSSPYCSDMAKMIDAPVIHVNGDDPEACIVAARLASEYRMKFNKDVVIDMWCYRRHGHNEGDEPMFTQPMMYNKIKNHPRTVEIYAKKLIDSGVISQTEYDNLFNSINEELEQCYKAAKSYKPNEADWLTGAWSGFTIAPSKDEIRRGETFIDDEIFDEVSNNLVKYPKDFNINSKVKKRLEVMQESFKNGQGIDWASAEAMAFGSLLLESIPVRLSGEDCERGTFSQRHSVLNDQETEKKYIPLNNIRNGQAKFQALDSPLSEFGLLGFEYGYAMSSPKTLVLWEAQFGDFANGAQVIIDQFIASGETKWLRMNGLVMLLPHGYEGQGPEHSSARLERYLQLSAEDNWQVCNITTPANYFHALRRQIKRNFRKPLILMTPKSLLRNKSCVSERSDFTDGSFFHRYYLDESESKKVNKKAREKVKRVIFCSGKLYYDLDAYRKEHKRTDVHILRIEQLYPFPFNGLSRELKHYKKADFIWCQEEPKNSGSWNYIDRIIEECLIKAGVKKNRPKYVGRIASASPATGLLSRHQIEQQKLIEEAFKL
ncbi:MAG: 2-oxoglutarate dehydrogenase E1 component [Alphaproteobacteria bacterium]|nr:2-oxoglutarate dehydrogenase E1 component [Alphaproteobacteria bacterium]